jgi:hypothetical protein
MHDWKSCCLMSLTPSFGETRLSNCCTQCRRQPVVRQRHQRRRSNGVQPPYQIECFRELRLLAFARSLSQSSSEVVVSQVVGPQWMV